MLYLQFLQILKLYQLHNILYYCINKGYAVFRKVVMIEQNDEYCIVETGTTYGLSQFDYIVRNGNTVKEDDILFK